MDGQTERFNRTLMGVLRNYIGHKHDDWEDVLELVCFAYRASFLSSIRETPYFPLHGRDPPMLIDRFLDPQMINIITTIESTNLDENQASRIFRTHHNKRNQHTNEQKEKPKRAAQQHQLLFSHCPAKSFRMTRPSQMINQEQKLNRSIIYATEGISNSQRNSDDDYKTYNGQTINIFITFCFCHV